jgi:hypothetical protein
MPDPTKRRALFRRAAPADATSVMPNGTAVNPITGMQGNNPLSDLLDIGGSTYPYRSEMLTVAPAERMQALMQRFAADPTSRPDSAELAQRVGQADHRMARFNDRMAFDLREQQESLKALQRAGRPEANPQSLALLHLLFGGR